MKNSFDYSTEYIYIYLALKRLPKKVKNAVLLLEPLPENPCCVRLEIRRTFPLGCSGIIS